MSYIELLLKAKAAIDDVFNDEHVSTDELLTSFLELEEEVKKYLQEIRDDICATEKEDG
jgi:hypothetical protein